MQLSLWQKRELELCRVLKEDLEQHRTLDGSRMHLLYEMAEELGLYAKESTEVWDRDIVEELYTNPSPTKPHKWAERECSEITHITLHHTLSHAPHWLFENYCRNKGRPTGPYTLWVTPTGEVLRCVPLETAVWHDHTGFHVDDPDFPGNQSRRLWSNRHLAIGVAGELHKYEPALIQMLRLVKLCADIIKSESFPLVDSPVKVKGHMDYFNTDCPGWLLLDKNNRRTVNHWKADFFRRLEEELA